MKKLLKIGDFKVLWLFVLGIGIGILISVFVPQSELEEAVAQQSKSPTIVNEMVVRKLKVVDAEGNIVMLIDSNAAGGVSPLSAKMAKLGLSWALIREEVLLLFPVKTAKVGLA